MVGHCSPATRSDFLALMRREPGAHRIIWTGDLTYWRIAMHALGELDEKYLGPRGILQLQLDQGMFPYFQFEIFWPFDVNYSEVAVESKQDGHTTSTTWRTPRGTLTGETRYLPESFSTAQTQYPVRTPEDLDVLCFILEDQSFTSRFDEYEALAADWGEAGYPSVGLPRAPMSKLVVEWAGAMNTAYLAADAPQKVEEALRLLERNYNRALDMVIEASMPVVHFPDNLSSETYTSFFDRFMAPCYRRSLDRLHASGVRCAVHLDGTVRGLLPKLSGVGFDAVESLTQAPVGDVAVGEMRRLAGRDDLVLWGGVPGAIFSRAFPQKRFVALVEEALAAWCGEWFILGTADQVPPDGDIERCHIVSELVARAQG